MKITSVEFFFSFGILKAIKFWILSYFGVVIVAWVLIGGRLRNKNERRKKEKKGKILIKLKMMMMINLLINWTFLWGN